MTEPGREPEPRPGPGTGPAPRPHDLLRLADAASVGGPTWVTTALERAPWVVVRRGPAEADRFAIGVRGPSRGQRFGTTVRSDVIAEIVTPTMLLERPRPPGLGRAVGITLDAVGAVLGAGVCWGPGGSVGFGLASGVDVTTPDSDLDVVIRLDRLPARPVLARWARELAALPTRVDAQLDLPPGGVALAEAAAAAAGHGSNHAGTVLLRTAGGPELVAVATLAAPVYAG